MDAAPQRPPAALFEGLLLAEGAVAARSPLAELAGPRLVPAPGLADVREQLDLHAVGARIVLVASPAPGDPAGLTGLREARNLLLDDDRFELTGVHVPLPAGAAMADLLAGLDFTAPAWVEVAPVAGWEAALAELVEDGAERLAVRLPADAAVLCRAVDLGLPLRVTGSGPAAASTVQVLAALCAVHAAATGAQVSQVAALLSERDAAPLAEELRRWTGPEAARVRAALDGVVVDDVEATWLDLAALGLLEHGHAED
ncbi:MAG TPA: hypothetical protein VE781_03100 [Kineosporiaceae bacterium]|nr:hypothetical protein [Kineosporiaceae bacterium]